MHTDQIMHGCNSLAKWYIIILCYQVYRIMLYLFWTMIEPITMQNHGALVLINISVNQLLLYEHQHFAGDSDEYNYNVNYKICKCTL